MAENRAKPVRTMAASFARKPFLFSEVLSTVLGRFISGIDRQYAENMRYSHPRWGRPNWFSGKHFSVENSVLTIDSEKFQSIVADFRLRRQVFDNWWQSAQHYWRGMAWYIVWPGGHGMVYDMAWRGMWKCLCEFHVLWHCLGLWSRSHVEKLFTCTAPDHSGQWQ